jgi:hypothetical protein
MHTYQSDELISGWPLTGVLILQSCLFGSSLRFNSLELRLKGIKPWDAAVETKSQFDRFTGKNNE